MARNRFGYGFRLHRRRVGVTGRDDTAEYVRGEIEIFK